MIRIENGRRINVPDSGLYGSEIIDAVGPKPGRRVVLQRGIEAETVRPERVYTKADLIDRKGRAVKATEIPDRTKGSFWAERSELSKHIITEQVYDIAANCFKNGVDFDDQNADWMIVTRYVLPRTWHHITTWTPLMVVFPTEYPTLPPIGFYMKSDISLSPNGHLYQQAYHEACKEPLDQNWKWYCVYVAPGSWRPAPIREEGDWRRGDNIWHYFTLINEALTGSTD